MQVTSITDRLRAAVWARDLLGESGCTRSIHCSGSIDWFRAGLVQKESQRLYRGFTVPRLVGLDEAPFQQRHYSIAAVDLSRFPSVEALLDEARQATSRKGRVNREVNKAIRLGYRAHSFDGSLYAPDMYEVHVSKSVRGGKALKDSYKASVEELRAEAEAEARAECPVHRRWLWGVFESAGDAQDEKLVAYLRLIRSGNFVFYGRIVGHGDYLRHGVMYLLHFSFLQQMVDGERTGLRFVFYNAFHSGPRDGSLTRWKQRCLFEPRYLMYGEPSVPAWYTEDEALPQLSRRKDPPPPSSDSR